jgi:hypothetical protein
MTRPSQHGLLLPAVLVSLLSACGEPVDPPTGPGCFRTISADITTASTWSPGEPVCEYAVEGEFKVSAALTIAPGTVVRFGPNAGLMVTETGSLNAVGTEASPITFTGKTATPGYWKGLAFRSNNPANVIDHAVISYAGSEAVFCCDYFYGPGGSIDARAAVVLGGGVLDSVSQLRLAHTTVEKSGTQGLFAFNKARLPGFERNLFRGNGSAPVTVSLSIVGALDSASIYSGHSAANPQDNGENRVRIIDAPDDDSNTSQTIHKLDVPYGVSTGIDGADLEYGGALTIEAGTRLEFEANSGLIIASTGSLVANGSASERIVFTGRTPTQGFWKGISIRSKNAANVISYADVSHGGSVQFCCDYFTGPGGSIDVLANVSVGGAVDSAGGRLRISNSNLSESGHWGLFIFKNSSATQSGNTFSNNTVDVKDENAP